MAFSPNVRSSPALADSKRLRATPRSRSGDIRAPTSSTATTESALCGGAPLGSAHHDGRARRSRPPRSRRTRSGRRSGPGVGLARHEDGLGQVSYPQTDLLGRHSGMLRRRRPTRWGPFGGSPSSRGDVARGLDCVTSGFPAGDPWANSSLSSASVGSAPGESPSSDGCPGPPSVRAGTGHRPGPMTYSADGHRRG